MFIEETFYNKRSVNYSDTGNWLTYPGRAWRGYFRLRLQGIRYSNKPAIRLKAIRERKNSLRSDNILSLINAAPQTLTISNVLPQSPSASPPRPSRKVHQQGCIRPIFCVHPIESLSPIIARFTADWSKDLTLSTTFPFQPVSLIFIFVGATSE